VEEMVDVEGDLAVDWKEVETEEEDWEDERVDWEVDWEDWEAGLEVEPE